MAVAIQRCGDGSRKRGLNLAPGRISEKLMKLQNPVTTYKR